MSVLIKELLQCNIYVNIRLKYNIYENFNLDNLIFCNKIHGSCSSWNYEIKF